MQRTIAAREGTTSAVRAAVALGLIASVVGFAGSWVPSLWTDEAATITAASMSWSDLWSMLHTLDAVHGLGYAFMHVWIQIAGISEVALRLPGAIAMGVAAAGAYVVGRQLKDHRLGVWTAIVLTVLPRSTWAAVEARSYPFTVAVGVWATVALLAALARPSALRWVVYGVVMVVGTVLNIYVILLLPAHGLALLLTRGWRDRTVRQWFVSGGLSGVAVLPFVAYVAGQKGQLGEPTGGLVSVARQVVVNQYFLGQTPTLTTGAAGPQRLPLIAEQWKPASVVLAAFATALVVLGLVRVLRGGAVDLQAHRLRPWVWALSLVVVPTVLAVCYSQAVSPTFYSPRYLTFTLIGAALLIAEALTNLPRRAAVAVFTVLVLLSVPIYSSQRITVAKSGTDWSQAADYLAVHGRAGDGVYFTPRYKTDAEVVGRTARTISVAYPDAFVGLVDLTAIKTPAQAHNLVGTSRRIADSTAGLDRVQRVWVLGRRDYDLRSDDQVLTQAGFTRGRTWSGPLTTVIEYVR